MRLCYLSDSDISAVILQLDAAAPLLAQLDQPIMIAKINADKYRNLAAKYEIE